MNNYIIVAIYLSLAIFSLVIFLSPLRNKERSRLEASLQFLAAMLFCWQFSQALFFACGSVEVSYYLYDLNIPFVALTCLAYFLFIIRFYGLESYFSKTVIAALFVYPVITAVIAAAGPSHRLLRDVLDIIQTYPLHKEVMTRGPWFWVHGIYCYLIIIAGFIIAIIQNAKIPKAHKRPSLLLLAGISISAAGNIFVVIASYIVDISLISISISSYVLYYAMRKSQGLDFFLQARREIFHCLDKAIIILDGDGDIVSMNRTAKKWLTDMGIDHQQRSYSAVEKAIAERAVRKQALEDEQGGVDYHLDSKIIYNVRNKPITDHMGRQIETFMVIEDVTRNREMIEKLDSVSGIDALTGLGNRRTFLENCKMLDQAQMLPLSVVMGDLNNLKTVNDAYGHHQGDALLRVVAETLIGQSPPTARISRIGGDEFVILLPQCTPAQARALIEQIRQALDAASGYPFIPSLALGYSVKEVEGQELQHAIDMADANMYQDKARQKG